MNSLNSFSICIQRWRLLWGTGNAGVVVSSVIVIEVRRVEEVETLQRALHRQTEAGRPTSVTWQTALWRNRGTRRKKRRLNTPKNEKKKRINFLYILTG